MSRTIAVTSLLLSAVIPLPAVGQNGRLSVVRYDDGGSDDVLINAFNDHVAKCTKELTSFRSLIERIEASTHTVSVQVGRVLGVFVAGVEPQRITFDLSDLEVFPNPVKEGGAFKPVSGVPPWASTVCSTLGHELAESFDNLVNGFKYARSHVVGSRQEDEIVLETFGENHGRGGDCRREHGNHVDFVLELGAHTEVQHQTASLLLMSSYVKDGTVEYASSKRLAYVTYENSRYPGRVSATDARCRP